MEEHDGYGAEMAKREALIDQAVASFPPVFAMRDYPDFNFTINRKDCYWDSGRPMLDLRCAKLSIVYRMTPESLRQHIMPRVDEKKLVEIWRNPFDAF